MEWITPDELATRLRLLDPIAFVSLCNELLAQAASRGQIDSTCLDLTLHVSDPDGGVDARCSRAPHVVGRLIPAPDVIYQFKGGPHSKSAANIARKDIAEKPEVVAALARGEILVYIGAPKYGPSIAQRVRESLAQGTPTVARRKRARSSKPKSATKARRGKRIKIRADQLVVINGDTLAHELQSYPQLIARFLKLDQALFAIEDWARFTPMTNQFETDAELDAQMRDLRAQMEREHGITRVVGPAGIGKTRIILEVLKSSSLSSEVLYAAKPDDVSAAVWAYLSRTPTVRCTLVVDEVNDVEAANLRDRFALTKDGIRLVTIGRDASRRSQPGTVRIDGPSEEVLVRAIEAVAPGIPKEAAKDVAKACERSPKLAILLASRAQQDSKLVEHYHRLADPEIQSVLNRFLPLDEDDVLALSTVALLDQVGWENEAGPESTALFTLVGLPPIEARDRVNRLDADYGVAPLVGRYRYVSPEILADHLAARQLNAWDGDRFRRIFDELPQHMAASLAARIRRLAGVLGANARIVQEVILDDQGPFRTLAELESGRRLANLLPELAGAFPRASLRALTRLLGPASDEDLRAATSSRRPLVNALTELLWSQDTFEEAATLLLRLATNEIEEFSNNATGVFVETFQTQLGRTAAGADIRARVLRKAAGGETPRERQVAAMAIKAALNTGHIVRMGMPPRDVPGMPEHEWRPKTWGEWWDAVETYLAILTPLLTDSDTAVRVAAVEALAEAAVLACDVSRITDRWIAAGRQLIGADFDLRSKLINALELDLERLQLRDDPTGLTEEQMAQHVAKEGGRVAKLTAFRDELAGTDFSSRFRSALSRTPWSSIGKSLDQGTRAIRQTLQEVAAEVAKEPSALDGEWSWLLKENTNQPEEFALILGRTDRDRRIAEKLGALARDHERAVAWLSLYEIGYGEALEDVGHVDRVAASLVGNQAGAGQLFDLLLRAGPTPERTSLVVGLLRSKAIPGRLIASLAYAPWRGNLSPEDALDLASTAADDPTAIGGVVSFLAHYLHDAPPPARKVLRNLVLRMLAAPRPNEKRRGFDWEWEELATLFVSDAPAEVGAAVLREIAEREHAHIRGMNDLVRKAWDVAPDKRQFFETVVAPWIDAENAGGWWVRQALEHFPVQELGVEFLVDWVAEKPDPRAHNLATIIGEPLARPSDLHAALLAKFADNDVGDVFFGSLVSGTWTGSAAGWSKGRLAEVKKLLEDERPVIKEWASRAVANLEQMVEADLVRDAEDRIHRR